jgi:hypothetical protein
MKIVVKFSLLASLILAASCQREITDELLTEPGNQDSATVNNRVMLVNTQIYDPEGFAYGSYYTLYEEDTLQKTITAYFDTLDVGYYRYYYDDLNRLTKILIYNADTMRLVNSRDSFVFTRPAENKITMTYDGGVEHYDIADIGGGRKKILITQDGKNPQYHRSEFYLSSGGWPDSTIELADRFNTNQSDSYRTHYRFDASGKPLSIQYRFEQDPSSGYQLTDLEFNKDAQPNIFLDSFLGKLAGSDMQWNLLLLNKSPSYELFYEMSDHLFLRKGTVLNLKYRTRIYDRAGNLDVESILYDETIEPVYDTRGRITKLTIKNKGKMYRQPEITYYR